MVWSGFSLVVVVVLLALASRSSSSSSSGRRQGAREEKTLDTPPTGVWRGLATRDVEAYIYVIIYVYTKNG